MQNNWALETPPFEQFDPFKRNKKQFGKKDLCF